MVTYQKLSNPFVYCCVDLQYGFDAIKAEQVEYNRKYTYDTPLVMPLELAEELRQVGLVLYKAILHMLEHYENYLDIMPRMDKELQILEICRRHPYRVGSFRPDFVISESGDIKIIEINARQPLNGLFSSGFFREIALRQAEELRIEGVVDLYTQMYRYLEGYMGRADHICAIQGSFVPAEIKFYPTIFEQAGMHCDVISLEQLPHNLHRLNNAWVVQELMYADFQALPLEIIDALAESNSHNSILTSLYAGNKRFFYALNHSKFLKNALEPGEIGLLQKYILPTYQYGDGADAWEDALRHKDGYILKHHGRGRSEEVYAGCLIGEPQWQALFKPAKLKDMILQPFVQQKRFQGYTDGEWRDDFVTGILLCFNQEFFGPGLYRTSSQPVTNWGTFRKMAQLVAEVDERVPGVHYL